MSPLDLDLAALRLARTRGHTAARDRAVVAFSRAGEHAACWFAMGAAGALTGRDRRGWLTGIEIVAAAYAINQVIKFAVRRRRPEVPELPPLTPTVTRLSFPSAHATTSFAAARAYGRLTPPAPLYAVAAAMALSRPYLGVHYPSDVLAGAALGTVIAGAWPR